MQQFKALFKKEFSGYFKSYFAYMIFFIYLFVSVGFAFYVGSYLAIRDTTVFSLFYLQPIIFLFMVPAVTMKMWSEEYKSGTAEFLLTQPLSDKKIVIAKIAASSLFCVSMSLGLVPFIIYTSFWLNLDFGNIVCCFAGLWLLAMLFCAIGCLLSSFSKNIIISYLISVFVMTLLLVVPFTGIYSTFNNFLFGEIGISDLFAFVVFAAAVAWLNMQVLVYRRNVKKHNNLKLAGFSVLLLASVVLVNIILNLLFSAKIDCTSGRLYTPSEVSKQIVASLKEPYSFEIYIAKEYKAHNVEYFYYYEQVKRFLERYQKLSGGMLTVRAVEVEPYSELESMILRNGLYYEENSSGSFDYFGAFLRNSQGKGTVIRHFITERKAFLEKDIDKALLKVTRLDLQKVIGIYLDPTQNLEEFQGFLLNLENDFDVINVSEKTYEISPSLDMLILINPKTLPSYFIYAVDQYLVNGGKVAVFFDLLTENQSDITNLEDVKISKLFDHWGIRLNDKFISSADVNAEFAEYNKEIGIKNAVSFKFNNEMLDVKPFIYSGENLVGALFTGTMTSSYIKNPFEDSELLQDVAEHEAVTLIPSKLAIIGDVDLIEDYMWVNSTSSNKDPYSVIVKNGNIEYVRNLIDEMLEITEYKQLPIRTKVENLSSIGKQINTYAYLKYESEFSGIVNELQNKEQMLIEKSSGNQEKLQNLLQIDMAGRDIADLEKKLDRIVYEMKQIYQDKVSMIGLLTIGIMPLTVVLILYLICFVLRRRMVKEAKELSDE